MLHDAQRTSAPSALSVSMSTAVWMVMCREPAMRAPRSGCCGANSSRIAIRPGISVSAIAISLRPQPASATSATLKSANFRVSVTAFISHSLSGTAPWETFARHPAREPRFNERRCKVGESSSLAGRASNCSAVLLQRSSRRPRIIAQAPPLPSRAAVLRRRGIDRRLALRQQRVYQARFTLVETLRMKGFLEREQLVVEVMAEFVDYGAQKGLEGDDLALARGAHPGGEPRRCPPLFGLVEAVQLAIVVGGAFGQHAHPEPRDAIAGDKRVDEALALALHRRALVGTQRGLDACDGRAKIESGRQAELSDAIAAAIDFLARRRESLVVAEAHHRAPAVPRHARAPPGSGAAASFCRRRLTATLAPEASAMLMLKPHTRDLGGFTVQRLLPSASAKLIGPFIFFDHFGPVAFAPGRGADVRPHPHIGLATVTYLFEGDMIHRDSLGTVQRIEPGAVNWMTAGSGIVHSERTAPEARARGHRMHGIQTWVALPQEQERVDPSFSHQPKAALPELAFPGVTMRLLAGTAFGRKAPTPVFSPMHYLALEMEPGAALEWPPEHEERGVYAVAGDLR